MSQAPTINPVISVTAPDYLTADNASATLLGGASPRGTLLDGGSAQVLYGKASPLMHALQVSTTSRLLPFGSVQPSGNFAASNEFSVSFMYGSRAPAGGGVITLNDGCYLGGVASASFTGSATQEPYAALRASRPSGWQPKWRATAGSTVVHTARLTGRAKAAAARLVATNPVRTLYGALHPAGHLVGVLPGEHLRGAHSKVGRLVGSVLSHGTLHAAHSTPTGHLRGVPVYAGALKGSARRPRGVLAAESPADASLRAAHGKKGVLRALTSGRQALPRQARAHNGQLHSAVLAEQRLAAALGARGYFEATLRGALRSFTICASTKAVAESASTPYRDLQEFGGEVWACTPTGIVVLGAEADDGVPITASFETYPIAPAGGQQVQLSSVYLNGRVPDGTVTVNAENLKHPASYSYRFIGGREGLWKRRAVLGRGLRADRVSLKVEVTGQMALTTLDLDFVTSSRRL